MASAEQIATEINESTNTSNNDQKEEQDTDVTSKATHEVDPSIHMDRATIFTIPSGEEDQKATKFFNKDVKVRIVRWSFMAFMPMLFLWVLTLDKKDSSTGDTATHLSELIGISVELIFVGYFGLVSYLFWSGARKSKGRHLFRIWTRNDPVNGWASMNIATHQQIYEFEAIQSISEFSAIDGGVASIMLSNLGPFVWAIVTMHFAAELHCNCFFEWDFADILEIIGITGLVMIGVFELDPYNPGMKFFHYLGAAAGIGTVAGYSIQSYSLMQATGKGSYLVAPIFIGTICLTCFFLWQFGFNKATVKYQNEIREKYNGGTTKPTDEELKVIKERITKLSLQNVISEGIFLFMGATSLALYMIFYNRECKIGCVGSNYIKGALCP